MIGTPEDEADLSGSEAYYEQEERGYPPYHPRTMTKILVYGYCAGVFSPWRLRKRLQKNVAFPVLAAGNEPEFRTSTRSTGGLSSFKMQDGICGS